MAIKIRRGKYSDYDPSKLVSGELAVVLEGDPNSKTGRSLYVCFQPGTVKRIVDYDDLVDLLANASDTYVEKISDEYLSNINTATDSANKAASSATAASESATSAAGNANKAASEASTQAERAETALAGLGSAITSDKVKNNLTTMDAGYVLDARQGKVLNDKFGSYVPTANIVDNLTTASSSKVLSANQGKALADRMTTVETDINSPTAVTDPADKTVLLSGGSGIDYAKLADAIIARYNANSLINNVTTDTAAQGALDAAQGKALSDLIAANKTDISSLNGSLNNKVDISNEIFKNNGYVSDADQCSRTGIYWTSDNSAHVNGYGVLLVFESAPGAEFSANNWITQMFLYNYENNIKIRKKIGTDNWTAWQTIG